MSLAPKPVEDVPSVVLIAPDDDGGNIPVVGDQAVLNDQGDTNTPLDNEIVDDFDADEDLNDENENEYQGLEEEMDPQVAANIALLLKDLMNSADESITEDDEGFVDPYDVIDNVRDQIGDLFAFDRKWYKPLLATPRGLQVFGQLLSDDHFVVDNYDPDVDLDYIMTLCFRVQAMIQTHSAQAHELMLILPAFPRSLFKAIRHYLHPDQAEAFAQLKASLSHAPSTLTLPQRDVPPEALPLLFPNIDTTQFAPQFDWFIYLLSQFSPVDEASYTSNLSTLLDTAFHPTQFLSLKPGLTLDKVFTHNHLINSYDEFLHHKLPQILPDSPLPSNSDCLFPYFPDQHPLLPSITSKDDFSALLSNPTDIFRYYFIYMFTLGPWIQSTTSIPNFYAHPVATPFALSTKLALHQYRAWYRSRDLKTTIPASSSSTVTSAITNDATTNNLQPPDFATSPLALLPLTVLPYSPIPLSQVISANQLPQSLQWSIHQPPSATQAYYRFLFHILSHYFPDEPTYDHIIDAALTRLLAAYQPGSIIEFSSTLHKHGYTTLHQHAYRLILKAHTGDITLDNLSFINRFLLHPIQLFFWWDLDWNMVSQHISLSVHAGFLSFSPLKLPPSPGARPSHHLGNHHLGNQEKVPPLSHIVTTFRSTLHSLLVRLTGFISYFPQSTQLLANAVALVAAQSRFLGSTVTWVSRAKHQVPFFPPHSSSIHDPRDSMPNLKEALVDDDGKLYAVRYDGDELVPAPAGDEKKDQAQAQDRKADPIIKKTGWTLPLRGAPRSQHILQDTALDDLRVCMHWNQGDLRASPTLNVDQDCNPYSRSRIACQDMAD